MKKPAYPNGYVDSRFFKLVGYNTITKKTRDLGRHDGIKFMSPKIIYSMSVFVDGSYVTRFEKLVRIQFDTHQVYID